MEAKHTPETCDCAVFVTTERPLRNAKITSDLVFCPLHAAAPELLAACEKAIHLLEMLRDTQNGRNAVAACNLIAEPLRAAIFKAQGGGE